MVVNKIAAVVKESAAGRPCSRRQYVPAVVGRSRLDEYKPASRALRGRVPPIPMPVMYPIATDSDRAHGDGPVSTKPAASHPPPSIQPLG